MTDTVFPDTKIEENELESIGAELTLSSKNESSSFLNEGKDCDAMLVVYATVGAEVIEKLSRCKVIVRTGIGVNNIDIEAATKKGIKVANVPDYCLDEVADHTIALYLSGVRKIVYMRNRVKEGFWNIKEAKPIPRLRGKTYGLLGCGEIGQRVAARATALGMKVVGYDPFLPEADFKSAGIIKISDFDVFLASVDALSLHAPLTEDTQHIINRRNIEKMKPTAFLINTSRGQLINEEDLYNALSEGVIAGAGLDVMETEPPDSVPPPLVTLPNVIVTPHMAFVSEESVPELRRKGAQEIARTLKDGKPKFWVNKAQMAG